MKVVARCKAERYNRAGVQLQGQWAEYDVLPEQLEILKGDPRIEIQPYEEPKAEVVEPVVEIVEEKPKKRGRKPAKKK